MAARPYLSIVIPVFNEAANVAELHQQLTASLEPMGRPYEILIVDDGSTDGTLQRLVEIEGRDRRVRVLRLRRNFGQTAAFSAGFDHARGEIVVTSDGDLQNDPADIPRLWPGSKRAFDLVCGWRKERQDPLSKKLPSWFANRLISWATACTSATTAARSRRSARRWCGTCGSTARCTASFPPWPRGWACAWPRCR